MSTKSPLKASNDSPRTKLQVRSSSSRASNGSNPRSRRLLIPTAHEITQPRSPATPVRRTKSSSSGIRLTRLARGDPEEGTSMSQPKVYASQKQWWCALGQLIFVGQMEVEGYQIYAVERWIVERRPISTLTVYTGKAEDKITVSVLELDPTLASDDSQSEFDRVIHRLRRDGARPKDIGVGILMVTSLMNFRSDYTIVYIPNGNFLALRDRICCNINLLRMGCSGRSPLMLDEPNDTTKDRFLQSYTFPESLRQSSAYQSLICSVLGLVRLLQLSLFFFGRFDVESYKCDGLLCDYTLKGLESWTEDIGEPKFLLEPAERAADPTVVAALLSTVVTMRNKLSNIRNSYNVPRDPFKHPLSFSRSINSFLQTQSATCVPTSASSPRLDLEGLKMIDSNYSKARQNEAYHKVRKALKNKLDDISRELLPSHDGRPRQVYVTSDLSMLVGIVTRGDRDLVEGASSLQKLWSGRIHSPHRVMDVFDGAGLEDSSDDDDDLLAHLWKRGPVRVQKTLESWTGWEFGIPSRSKDASNSQSGLDIKGSSAALCTSPYDTLLPPVTIDGDEYASATSSGPESPTKRSHDKSHSFALTDNRSKENLEKFRRARPRNLPNQVIRLTSWADPFSAAADEEDAINVIPGMEGEQSYTASLSPVKDIPESLSINGLDKVIEEKRVRIPQRRHSFANGDNSKNLRILPMDYMKIDVDLCGEVLIARMHEIHINNLLQLLGALEGDISMCNSMFSEMFGDVQPILKEINERSRIIQSIQELDAHASDAKLQAATVNYQSQQITTEKIRNNVQKHRQDVARIRANVYPIKPRDLELERQWFEQGRLDHLLPKESRFKFIANTIDARRQYVDGSGKTEEEIAEEEAVRCPEGLERKEPVRPDGEEVHTQRSWSQWLLAQVWKVESVWGRGQTARTTPTTT